MKIAAYKRVLIVIGILLSLVILNACNATKQFKKAVNKYGQKEAANYMVVNYPEYFYKESVKDTIFINKDIIVPSDSISTGFTNCDSLFKSLTDGTTTILEQNDRLKLEVYKLNNKLKFKSVVKPDTIHVTDTIKVEIPVVLPDTNKLNFKDLSELAYKSRLKSWIIGFLSLLLIIFSVILYKNKSDINKNEGNN